MVGGTEYFNEATNEFETRDTYGPYLFEHSLYTISMWEEEHKKPFINAESYTDDELKDYVRIMAYRNPFDISILTEDDYTKIGQYMNDNRTATTIQNRDKHTGKPEIVTSEVLYAAMFEARVPLEAEHWHVSRLYTLLQVMRIRQGGERKMTPDEIRAENKRLNDLRRKQLNTRG